MVGCLTKVRALKKTEKKKARDEEKKTKNETKCSEAIKNKDEEPYSPNKSLSDLHDVCNKLYSNWTKK